MRILILALISVSMVGCVEYTPAPSKQIYSMAEPMTLSDFAESQGWCDMEKPTARGSVYYVMENGSCVAKVY